MQNTAFLFSKQLPLKQKFKNLIFQLQQILLNQPLFYLLTRPRKRLVYSQK